MRYSTLIDNVASKEWGLNIQEAYLFSWIYTLPSWAERSIINGKDYYFASRNLVLSDLPLLTDKPDTIYRHYKKLEEKGVILLIKIGNKDYISLSDKAKKWGCLCSEKNPTLGKEQDCSEIFTEDVGKKSEIDPEKNPTNKSIKTDKINNINFSVFWALYPRHEKKLPAQKIWDKLSEKEKELALKDIPLYEKSVSEKKFLKHASSYLNQKTWLDRSDYPTDKIKSLTDPVKRFSLNDKYS